MKKNTGGQYHIKPLEKMTLAIDPPLILQATH